MKGISIPGILSFHDARDFGHRGIPGMKGDP